MRQRPFWFIIPTLACCFISCKENITGGGSNRCENNLFTIQDTMVFDLSQWKMPDIRPTKFYENLFGSPALSFFIPEQNKVIILDYKTKELIQEFDLKNIVSKGIYIRECFIANKDSAYVLHQRYQGDKTLQEVSLVHCKGDILKSWLVPSNRKNKLNYSLSSSSGTSFYKKGTAILSKQLLSNGDFVEDPVVRKMRYSSPTDVIMNLSGDTCIIEKEIGKYPERLFLTDKYYNSPNSEYFRVINNKDEIIYSFFIDDSIHVYSFEGKKKGSYRAKSAWFDFNKVEAFNPDSNINRNYTLKYWIEQSLYGKIIYDSYRKLYYRLIVHSLPYVREDGMLNLVNDQEFSLVVLDKDFNQVAESCFPGGKYYWNFMVVPEGLLITNNNKLKDHKVSYTLFKVNTANLTGYK